MQGGSEDESGGSTLAERLVTVELDDSDRQLVLCALALLSVERPGWDSALNEIAQRMDNVKYARAQMYDSFRKLRLQENPPTFWERLDLEF